MPTYEYQCTDCGEPLEVVQSFSDPSLTVCPSCSGRLRKVYSAVGVVFKGSGFYRTDSRDSGKKAAAGSPTSGSESSGESSSSGAKKSSESTTSSESTSSPASSGSTTSAPSKSGGAGDTSGGSRETSRSAPAAASS